MVSLRAEALWPLVNQTQNLINANARNRRSNVIDFPVFAQESEVFALPVAA